MTRAGEDSAPAQRAAHDERWLGSVWQRQAFDRRALHTTAGQAFKIVYPGRWTGKAGPDFHAAILALPDGRLVRGDVELHLDSAGWRQHGHHLDSAYNDVVLHVVLDAGEPARTSQGGLVPTLELGPRLGRVTATQKACAVQPAGNQVSYVVEPCRHVLPGAGDVEVTARLRSLALERFQAKQAVFEGELAVASPEQTLHAGLMEALGYSRNKPPFRKLARIVPVSVLACQGSAVEIERLLLASAGFIGDHARKAMREAGLIALPLNPEVWQQVGVRPGNLPQQRIRQFAAILCRLLPRLVDELLAPLAELDSDVSQGAVAHVRREWLRLLAEVGPQRADAMAINVLLPFAAAYGQATCQFLLSESAIRAFLAYPAQGANQATLYMRRDILGSLASCAAGAAGEQALMHVWERWCREKVCALCVLGRRSRQ